MAKSWILVLILLFYSCYKKETVHCEPIGKVCGEADSNGVRECEVIIECKVWT